MKTKNPFYLLAILFLLSNCATNYRPLLQPEFDFPSVKTTETLVYAYRYDVLNLRENRGYARRARRKGFQLLAVQVTNQSDRPLIFGQDILVYHGEKELSLMTSHDMYVKARQEPAFYWLYLSLFPIPYSYSTSNSFVDLPMGLVVGTGLSLGNYSLAKEANAQFLMELSIANILFKPIPPGETYTGLLGLNIDYIAPLKMKLSLD